MRKKYTVVFVRPGDLRLRDNPALSYAAKEPRKALACCILDPVDLFPNKKRSDWLQESLSLFSRSVQAAGFSWEERHGAAEEILLQLIRDIDIEAVAWNRSYEPQALTEQSNLLRALEQRSIKSYHFPGNCLSEPGSILNKEGKPYSTFTHFWNTLRQKINLITEAPNIEPQKKAPAPGSPGTYNPRQFPAPGEESALRRLERFTTSQLMQYGLDRDIPSIDGTSQLSAHLHFGEISVRHVWNRIQKILQEAKEPATVHQCDIFLKELAWREFALHLLFHFPRMPEKPLKTEFETFPYRTDDNDLKRWQDGQTGIPIVDAGMRQLLKTGWMHNRVRMVTGSFLVKQLLLHWKHGHKWFMEKLIDADAANNSLGWQWVAGCGADAAPYFRIFNPVLQGERFDPDGEYVRKYIPELAQVPKKYIHKPWAATKKELASWNVTLGSSYPNPIINLQEGRARALKAFSTMQQKKTCHENYY